MTAGANSVPDYEYCDLVMKGGITSGVIYPKAAAKLATRYRFKNIGGHLRRSNLLLPSRLLQSLAAATGTATLSMC
jgi:hypothetical protein